MSLTENQVFNKKKTHSIANQLGNFEVLRDDNPYHWLGTIKVNQYLSLDLDFSHKNRIEASLVFSQATKIAYKNIFWDFDIQEAIGFGKTRDSDAQAASINTRLLIPYMDKLTEYVVNRIEKEERRIARIVTRNDFLKREGFKVYNDGSHSWKIEGLLSIEADNQSNEITINVDNNEDYQEVVKAILKGLLPCT